MVYCLSLNFSEICLKPRSNKYINPPKSAKPANKRSNSPKTLTKITKTGLNLPKPY